MTKPCLLPGWLAGWLAGRLAGMGSTFFPLSVSSLTAKSHSQLPGRRVNLWAGFSGPVLPRRFIGCLGCFRLLRMHRNACNRLRSDEMIGALSMVGVRVCEMGGVGEPIPCGHVGSWLPTRSAHSKAKVWVDLAEKYKTRMPLQGEARHAPHAPASGRPR